MTARTCQATRSGSSGSTATKKIDAGSGRSAMRCIYDNSRIDHRQRSTSSRRPPSTAVYRLSQCLGTHAVAEIAEPFVAETSPCKEPEQRIERIDDFSEGEPISDRPVQPGAFEIAANVERIEPGDAADDADIPRVGTGAAVWAAGDADAQPLAFQPQALEPRQDLSDQIVANALGLGDGEPAARQCRAGERPALGRTQFLGEAYAVCLQQIDYRIAIIRPDVAQDDVLARHQDRVAAKALDRFAQCAAQQRAFSVDYAATRDRYAEIEFAVPLLVPTEMIGHPKARHRPAWRERLAEIIRKPLARPSFAALGDHVFQPGMAPVAAVPPIAMQPHYRRCRLEQIVRCNKRDRGRQTRKCLRVVVGHPVTAAEQEIVPGEGIAREQRDDRKVVRQYVDGVVLRDCKADLEFARQIALTIDWVGRLGRAGAVSPRFAVDPDFVIRAGARQQVA